MKRSSHIPTRTTQAMAVKPRGLAFTARLNSTVNGMTNAMANTVQAIGAQAPCIR